VRPAPIRLSKGEPQLIAYMGNDLLWAKSDTGNYRRIWLLKNVELTVQHVRAHEVPPTFFQTLSDQFFAAPQIHESYIFVVSSQYIAALSTES
jgi:hypothetical protein